MLVKSILTSQTQLNTLLADTSTTTDGYYICNFANPVLSNGSLGSQNDIVLKISYPNVATSILVHRPYSQSPDTVSLLVNNTLQTYMRTSSGWASGSSGGNTITGTYTTIQRNAITTSSIIFNSDVGIYESYNGTNWSPLSPVSINGFNLSNYTTKGVYITLLTPPTSKINTPAISAGDIFYYDGQDYLLLYKWSNSPSSIYLNSTTLTTLLKSNSNNGWYFAPVNSSVDTAYLYATIVNGSNSPYTVNASDNIIYVDDTSYTANGVQVNAPTIILNLPPISSLAIPTKAKTIKIIRRGQNSLATVIIKASVSAKDAFIGTPVQKTELYMPLACEYVLTTDMKSDPINNPVNLWSVSNNVYDTGTLEWKNLITNDTIFTEQGGIYTINATSDLNLTLPLSVWGVGSIKFYRSDNNTQYTVKLSAPNNCTINGSSNVILNCKGTITTRTLATNNNDLLAEISQSNPQQAAICYLTKTGGNVVNNNWSFSKVDFPLTASNFYQYDPSGMYQSSTSRVFAKKTGLYKIQASIGLAALANASVCAIRIYVNGVYSYQEKWTPKTSYNQLFCNLSNNVYLRANDYVEMYAYFDVLGTNAIGYANLSVELIEGISNQVLPPLGSSLQRLQVNVNGTGVEYRDEPISVVKLTSRNVLLTTSRSLIYYDTVEKDNFSMYSTSTGQFTIPIPGFYVVSGFVAGNVSSGNAELESYLYKNGAQARTIAFNISSNFARSVITLSGIQCAAGDTLSIWSYGNNITLAKDPSYNYIILQRIGN